MVDDPYVQGKIGCANVLSDLYAMGIVDCDSMLMLLAASTQMEKQEQTIVTREMMKGFNGKTTCLKNVVLKKKIFEKRFGN